MALKFLPLTIRFDYFGSPGNGGSSKLALSKGTSGIKVVDGVPGEGDMRTGQVASEGGWRGVISYMVQEEVCAFFTDGSTDGEYPWPDRMTIKGAENFATELIACAWAGEPVAVVAQALSGHSDETLASLREKYGPFRGSEFLDEMLRIKSWADELSVDFTDIVDRGPRFGFDFRAMRRDVVALARVVRAEEKAAELRRAWGLRPFQARIEELVAAWRKANPATSTNSQMGKGMQAGALTRYLESYVLEHGRLPEGPQTVPATRQLQAFEVTLEP